MLLSGLRPSFLLKIEYRENEYLWNTYELENHKIIPPLYFYFLKKIWNYWENLDSGVD